MADHQEPKQHRMEQVFPPTFSCTSASNKIDLNDGMDDATSEKNTKSLPSVYDMVARRYIVGFSRQRRIKIKYLTQIEIKSNTEGCSHVPTTSPSPIFGPLFFNTVNDNGDFDRQKCVHLY